MMRSWRCTHGVRGEISLTANSKKLSHHRSLMLKSLESITKFDRYNGTDRFVNSSSARLGEAASRSLRRTQFVSRPSEGRLRSLRDIILPSIH
jgi:hypothetical protein